MQRFLFNFLLAVEQVAVNRLRSILTALGIVFGVAAVIAMLAIGSGARKSILDQMKLIGVNNIVLESLLPNEMEDAEEEEGDNNNTDNNKKTFSPGLNLRDVATIQEVVPGIEFVSPEIEMNTNLIYREIQRKGRCVGVNNPYFELNNLQLNKGVFFSELHLKNASPVCIIGNDVAKRFFNKEDPLGKYLKSNNVWLKVIGILESKNVTNESLESLGLRDLNDDIYVPVNTLLIRFKDRSNFIRSLVGNRNRRNNVSQNIHQLDKIVIRMQDSKKLQASADIMARILYRKHNGVQDYSITVPELLLEQEQKTQDTFNFVLAAIAGISLLVGGIGIMNIMLASVLERTKEIGIRRSLGATQKDITQQFVSEAVFISLLGGILGIILGVIAANVIANSADIPTIISGWSILLSFGVSSAVGLVFGIVPARRAAYLDPITALR
jgi:putative ABC transport system permease protein